MPLSALVGLVKFDLSFFPFSLIFPVKEISSPSDCPKKISPPPPLVDFFRDLKDFLLPDTLPVRL